MKFHPWKLVTAPDSWPKTQTRVSACGDYCICGTQQREDGPVEYCPFVRQTHDGTLSGIEAATLAELERLGVTPAGELQLMRDGWSPLHGSSPWPVPTWAEARERCERHEPGQRSLL